jgi:hypothetical protein
MASVLHIQRLSLVSQSAVCSVGVALALQQLGSAITFATRWLDARFISGIWCLNAGNA